MGNPKQKNTTKKRKHKSQNGNKHPQQETHSKKYKIKPQNWNIIQKYKPLPQNTKTETRK